MPHLLPPLPILMIYLPYALHRTRPVMKATLKMKKRLTCDRAFSKIPPSPHFRFGGWDFEPCSLKWAWKSFRFDPTITATQRGVCDNCGPVLPLQKLSKKELRRNHDETSWAIHSNSHVQPFVFCCRVFMFGACMNWTFTAWWATWLILSNQPHCSVVGRGEVTN